MLVALAEARLDSAGGKAAGLRRLLEARLPVPEGLCLPFEVYRRAAGGALPGPCASLEEAARASAPVRERLLAWRPDAALERALVEALSALAAPSLVVRSSASCEDLEQPSAGLFVSSGGVRELEGLVAAIRTCWLSLWELPAWAGLRLSGRWPGGEAMAVILQAEVEARWAGLLLSRDPGDRSRLRIEAVPRGGEALASGEADPAVVLVGRERGDAPASPLPPALTGFLRESALGLEAGLGAVVELEWAYDGERPWLLQLRPSRAAAPPRSFPLVWPSEREARLLWRWDREHNPDPLSPAHASLIALLEQRRPGPPRLIVQGGYLYTAAVAEEPAPREPLEAIWGELGRLLAEGIAALEAEPGADELVRLERALELFVRFYSSYAGPLAAARRAARAELRRFLEERGAATLEGELLAGPGHSTISRTEELFCLAGALRTDPRALDALSRPGASLRSISPALDDWLKRHLARYGSLSPVWDVASPTFAEEPALLLPRLASLAHLEESPLLAAGRAERRAGEVAAELAAKLQPREHARLYVLLDAARLARRLEEDDDLLFARALWLVRRALLRAGEALVHRGHLVRPAEVFLFSIDEVRAVLLGRGPERREEAQRRARELEESGLVQPPLTIQGDRLSWPPPPGRAVLRGAGVGGLARGRVRLARRLEDLLGLDTHGAVVVCPTLLPSLAVVIAEAAALVTDHGGLLSHAASLARELGVPAVVGTGTATRDLREGELVWVDGGRGTVVRDTPGEG